MRIATMAVIAATAVGLGGCGAATKTVTQTRPATTTTTSTTNAAEAQNNQVISAASSAPDNQAALGTTAIRKILVKKLGLDMNDDFDLNHHITADETAQDTGDCYVKLGADAVNSEDQTSNILRSPSGQDVVFVQSDTATPLVKCLVAVKTALGW